MTERVYVHVGCPKSGTTYLQRILRHNQASLAEQGVLVAGKTHVELVHAGFVVREDSRLENLPERAAGAWDRVVDAGPWLPGPTRRSSATSCSPGPGASRRPPRCRLWPGWRSMWSSPPATSARRSPRPGRSGSSSPSTTPLEEWEPPPESRVRAPSGAGAPWTRRRSPPAGVPTLPPERVHIVTAPRRGVARSELWDRFAEACSLQDVTVDLDIPPANESLGVKAAEVLAQGERTGPGPDQGCPRAVAWLRDTLAHTVLAPLDDEPMAHHRRPARRGARSGRARPSPRSARPAGRSTATSLTLAATRREGRLPGEVPADELLDVAVRTIAGLLLELREARATGGHGRAEGRGDADVPAWLGRARRGRSRRAGRCSTASPNVSTWPRRTSRRVGGCRSASGRSPIW